jgi:L-fucose dehydrogenase
VQKALEKQSQKPWFNEGALPVIVGRKEEDNNAAVKEIEKTGGKAFGVTAELSTPGDCDNAGKKNNRKIWTNRRIGEQCRSQ